MLTVWNKTNLLKELIHQIKDNKLLSDRGNAARPAALMVARTTRLS
jgi:hypothetical protein